MTQVAALNPTRCGETSNECERGMVTVEAAISFVALILVMGFLLTGITTVRTQAQVCQGAREVARSAAIGGEGQSVALNALPPGGSATISRDGTWVKVSATAPAGRLAGMGVGSLSCSVQTLREASLR